MTFLGDRLEGEVKEWEFCVWFWVMEMYYPIWNQMKKFKISGSKQFLEYLISSES